MNSNRMKILAALALSLLALPACSKMGTQGSSSSVAASADSQSVQNQAVISGIKAQAAAVHRDVQNSMANVPNTPAGSDILNQLLAQLNTSYADLIAQLQQLHSQVTDAQTQQEISALIDLLNGDYQKLATDIQNLQSTISAFVPPIPSIPQLPSLPSGFGIPTSPSSP